MARAALLVLGVLAALAGCASTDGGDDEAATGADALGAKPCAVTDTSIFFHGLSGYGRELAKPGLCVPNVNNAGAGNFWSDDISTMRAPAAKIAGGYSAGRIPLIRRLEKNESLETTAVMLDPSYADGPRFDGLTGPSIVDAWLDHDPARRFILVYLPASAGWREFAALTTGAHKDQVKICPMTGSHLDLPALVTAKLFVDPETWFAERCH